MNAIGIVKCFFSRHCKIDKSERKAFCIKRELESSLAQLRNRRAEPYRESEEGAE